MSLKKLLGLENSRITEWEIMSKLAEAKKKNVNELMLSTNDGNEIKISIPNMNYDPFMDTRDGW